MLAPARESTLHEARPRIQWRTMPGAAAYRIQMESRVPEGRVIERVDSRVSGTRFVPPRPLTDGRAAVKLLVTRDCPDAPSIADRPAWFFIDMAPTCPTPSRLSFSAAGVPRAEWSKTGASRYELEIYSMSDGRLLARQETTLTSWELPRASGALLVAVRPRCESAIGAAVYGFLPAPR